MKLLQLLKAIFFVLTGSLLLLRPTLTFAQPSKEDMKTGSIASSRVVPIGWSKFKSGPCALPAGQRFGRIVLNVNKYALNTWWQVKKLNQPALDLSLIHI